MQWADKLEFYDRLLQKGIAKEKDLEPSKEGFDYYIEAFFELGTCRSIGMGEGPIPFTAIIQYATLYNEEDIEEFSYIIRKLDNVYLNFKDKKNGPKTGKGNSSQGGHKGQRRS